jgi:N-formylglutamate deformylase
MTAQPPPVEVDRGDSPVILGMPHGGTHVPAAIEGGLNANGRLLADTDWHIDALHAGLLPGVTTVRATFHRYVIDANRDPSGHSLYPGQNTTGLVPLTDFDGVPISDQAPGDSDIAARVAAFHAPYHDAIRQEIARVKARHGVAILYDCHSIRSRIPFLFEGELPTLNIGTDNGATCDPRIETVARAIAATSGYSSVVNGRFRGGWTTRHYGRPETGVHAIQMETAQGAYLETEAPPFAFSARKAGTLRPLVAAILAEITELAETLKREHAQ